MKLSKIDHLICEALLKEKQGLSLLKLSRRIGKDPSLVYKSLNRLLREGVVVKVKTSCAIYQLSLKNKPEIAKVCVSCPKCKENYWIDANQNTKVCENPDCLTKSGKQTRFYIFDRRIIDWKRIR